MNKSFIQLCIEGKETFDNIDNYIEKWHSSFAIKEELHNFLGMTEKEYAQWVELNLTVEQIVNNRKNI